MNFTHTLLLLVLSYPGEHVAITQIPDFNTVDQCETVCVNLSKTFHHVTTECICIPKQVSIRDVKK